MRGHAAHGILGFIATPCAIRGQGPLMGIQKVTHTMRGRGELVQTAPIQGVREPLRLLVDHRTKAVSCRTYPTLNAPPYYRAWGGYGGLRLDAPAQP